MPFARALGGSARRVAVAGTAAALTGSSYLLLLPAIALDDSPPPPPRPSKLTIYPDPPRDLVLLDTPSRLEQDIGMVRRIGTRIYREGRGRVQGVVDEWIGVEQAVERKVKEIVPKDEPLTPGILYVGVATLSGSVLGRGRIFYRILLPPTFFIASMAYFLPKTSSNLYAFLLSLESHYAPALHAQQEALSKRISDTWRSARRTVDESAKYVEGGVKGAVEGVEGATGLKVGEVWGQGQKAVEGAKEQVEKGVEDLKEKIREKAKEEPIKRLV